jgi:hypothetical protein
LALIPETSLFKYLMQQSLEKIANQLATKVRYHTVTSLATGLLPFWGLSIGSCDNPACEHRP